MSNSERAPHEQTTQPDEGFLPAAEPGSRPQSPGDHSYQGTRRVQLCKECVQRLEACGGLHHQKQAKTKQSWRRKRLDGLVGQAGHSRWEECWCYEQLEEQVDAVE